MFYTRILSEKLPRDLAGNKLVKGKNFFDTVERCKLCGTGKQWNLFTKKNPLKLFLMLLKFVLNFKAKLSARSKFASPSKFK